MQKYNWMAPVAISIGLLGAPALAADSHADHAAPPAAGAPAAQSMPMMKEHMRMMQEAQDRAAIEDLMWRYARALDSSDADAYAAVYTEDGQFGVGERATKGRAALRKMVADLKQARIDSEAKGEPKRPGTLHMVANHSITFQDVDHATYDAYWMTMFTALGTETPARVGAVGRSVDEVVRVNGKWLIKSRNVTPQD